ncbi:MAG: oxidoreductase subunit of the alternative pyrimidine degradation pathway [Pseudomonadota bacterium]|jgi:3-hydroxypropanoate dehydrogenase
MSEELDQAGQDLLFHAAHTPQRFLDRPVTDETLERAWDLARMGPTAANGQPLRVLFLRGADAKARLLPALAPNNLDKTRSAPVTAIAAYDLAFFERLPALYPFVDARAWYQDKPALAEETAFRSGTLQAGYLILALRAVGLACGPMSGFDAARVDADFFAGTTLRSNLLINIGYPDPAFVRPRAPRLAFAEACTLL